MEIKNIFKDNIINKRVPHYIRDSNENIEVDPQSIENDTRSYRRFFRLLKILSNYIGNSFDQIEQIIQETNLDIARESMLETIAKRLGVIVEKPIDDEGKIDHTLYEERLKIAILGRGAKRVAVSSFADIDRIKEIYPDTTIEATDFSILAQNPVPMQLNISMFGPSSAFNEKLLEQDVLSRVTGVLKEQSYIQYGKNLFAFDSDIDVDVEEGINYGQKGWDEGEWVKTTIN